VWLGLYKSSTAVDLHVVSLLSFSKLCTSVRQGYVGYQCNMETFDSSLGSQTTLIGTIIPHTELAQATIETLSN